MVDMSEDNVFVVIRADPGWKDKGYVLLAIGDFFIWFLNNSGMEMKQGDKIRMKLEVMS